MIKLGVLAALDQRIALRYTMPAMTAERDRQLHPHHLKLAGRAGTCSPTTPSRQIHDAARGKPRAVNNLALPALVATYAAGKAIVDEHAARAAVTEVTTHNPGTSPTTTGTTTTKAPQPPRPRGLTAPPHRNRQRRLHRNVQ